MDCNGAFWFTYFARALCLGKLGQTLDILGETRRVDEVNSHDRARSVPLAETDHRAPWPPE